MPEITCCRCGLLLRLAKLGSVIPTDWVCAECGAEEEADELESLRADSARLDKLERLLRDWHEVVAAEEPEDEHDQEDIGIIARYSDDVTWAVSLREAIDDVKES